MVEDIVLLKKIKCYSSSNLE